jgi:hypothetical protein
MKSRLLLFSALVIHSFTTAQVGKVELVADILPGPGSSSPEIAGAIDDKLVVGEFHSKPGFDSVYALWIIDMENQIKIIGQRDTNFTYGYISGAFEYGNKIFFNGNDNQNNQLLYCLSNTDSLPWPVIDSFVYKGMAIDGGKAIASILPHQSGNRNKLIFKCYDWQVWPTYDGYVFAELNLDDVLNGKRTADVYPAFIEKKYENKYNKNTAIGLIKYIDQTKDEIVSISELYDTTVNSYRFCVYNIALDTIIVHDLTTFSSSGEYYLNTMVVANNLVFIDYFADKIQRWLVYDGHTIKEVPQSAGSAPMGTQYYNYKVRCNRDFVYYYNNKYWLNVLDSLGNSWLAGYDPVSNTTQKLYNFRVPNSSLAAFTYYAGDLYFCAETPQPSSNIFVFDGVNPPTLLDNIAQNVNITDARDFYVHNGSLYFSATDSLYGHQYGRELFKYTSPKAAIVKDVEPNAIRTLQVYPNPTNGVLQLEGLPNNGGSLQFQLYNTQGQRLDAWEEYIANTSYSVPASKLSRLAMGTYFIHVKSTQAPTTYLASFVKE